MWKLLDASDTFNYYYVAVYNNVLQKLSLYVLNEEIYNTKVSFLQYQSTQRQRTDF